jgi:hypothetical protein
MRLSGPSSLWNGILASLARRGRHEVTLEPHAYRWFHVGRLDYILHRRLS